MKKGAKMKYQKNNVELRDYAKKKKVYLWEVAENWMPEISEQNLSKMMRHELTEEMQKEFIAAVDRAAAEN